MGLGYKLRINGTAGAGTAVQVRLKYDCGANPVHLGLVLAARSLHPSVDHHPVGQDRSETFVLEGDRDIREGCLQFFYEGVHSGKSLGRSPVHIHRIPYHKAGYSLVLGVFFEIFYYLCRIDRVKGGSEYAEGVAHGNAGASKPEVYSYNPVHIDVADIIRKDNYFYGK